MKYREYLGGCRLAHYAEKKKGIESRCIYCGALAKTREHTPSKVFLNKPRSENLPMTPSCEACNNVFSRDDLNLCILVETYKAIYLC